MPLQPSLPNQSQQPGKPNVLRKKPTVQSTSPYEPDHSRQRSTDPESRLARFTGGLFRKNDVPRASEIPTSSSFSFVDFSKPYAQQQPNLLAVSPQTKYRPSYQTSQSEYGSRPALIDSYNPRKKRYPESSPQQVPLGRSPARSSTTEQPSPARPPVRSFTTEQPSPNHPSVRSSTSEQITPITRPPARSLASDYPSPTRPQVRSLTTDYPSPARRPVRSSTTEQPSPITRPPPRSSTTEQPSPRTHTTSQPQPQPPHRAHTTDSTQPKPPLTAPTSSPTPPDPNTSIHNLYFANLLLIHHTLCTLPIPPHRLLRTSWELRFTEPNRYKVQQYSDVLAALAQLGENVRVLVGQAIAELTQIKQGEVSLENFTALVEMGSVLDEAVERVGVLRGVEREGANPRRVHVACDELVGVLWEWKGVVKGAVGGMEGRLRLD